MELRRIEIRLAAKSNNKQIININRQYYLYSHDRRVVVYPPSYGSVGSFLVHFVANVLSNLRVLCARAEAPWLSPSDMVRISLLIRQLKLDDVVEVKRKDLLLRSKNLCPTSWRPLLLLLVTMEFFVVTSSSTILR
jgi:hypothetical protein